MKSKTKATPNTAVVVIGRDSLSMLQSIYSVRYVAEMRKYFNELIYVDSASSDLSLQYMQSCGFRTYSLNERAVLSAAAGRCIGTIQARSERILYLDSDMQLEDLGYIEERMEALDRGSGFVGIVGPVRDIYKSGLQRIRGRKISANGEARTFGGFLMVDRAAVLSVGNWNASMYANEELELHARLRKAGFRIRFDTEFGVRHFTESFTSPFKQLLSVYLPHIAPKRYGAFGRAVAAALRAGSFLELVKLAPEPLLLVMAFVPILVVGNWQSSLVLGLLYEVTLLRRRSWKYNLIVPGIVVSMPYGIASYRVRRAVVDK